MDISDFRREYLQDGLRRDNLETNPFLQFEKWFKQACESKIADPNAMSLSTVSKEGKPTLRTVLLKTFDESGFVFYTNYNSQKAKQIAENPNIAILFPWTELERQIEVTGKAVKVSTAESLKYFTSRPVGSQLGAWASDQSARITTRKALEMQLQSMKDKFLNKEIPLPDFWGGFRLIPETIEFWQGGANRLHDRFEYRRQSEDSEWEISRLAP